MDNRERRELENARRMEKTQKRFPGYIQRTGKVGQQTVDKITIKSIIVV